MSRANVEHLFRHFEESPNDVAFIERGDAVTYSEIERRARSYARSLEELGVRKGDRVGVFVDGSIEMVVALIGHYFAGIVHLPINTRYGAVEIGHILDDSGARALLHPATGELFDTVEGLDLPDTVEHRIALGGEAEGARSFSELCSGEPMEGAPRPSDEDLALLIYTSGTTGRSKGVELPFRAVVSNIDALTRLWEWTNEDILLLALPLFHVHGLCIGVHGTILRGCRAIIHERFSAAEVVAEMGQGATIFMGVPTMYARIVDHLDEHPERADWMKEARLYTSGSAALSPSIFERFEEHTGHRILERYGMSETLLTLSNPYRGERRPGTVGLPVPGCDVRVVDENFEDTEDGEVGEIVVRGPSVMRGYRGLPDKTEKAFNDGWFLTGDVAKRGADRYVSIVGRRSVDIIKSGGYKISAREIEEVLERHEEVAAVAVVGLPDEEWGERIVAAVVPAGGAQPGIDELNAFCAGKLADYKQLRDLILVDEIPRNALGKVQKHRVVERFES